MLYLHATLCRSCFDLCFILKRLLVFHDRIVYQRRNWRWHHEKSLRARYTIRFLRACMITRREILFANVFYHLLIQAPIINGNENGQIACLTNQNHCCKTCPWGFVSEQQSDRPRPRSTAGTGCSCDRIGSSSWSCQLYLTTVQLII